MILIDMNQIAVANLMMNLKMNNSKTVDESMVRHMILNSIRMYRKEHHDEYGEVVLTWDSKHSWRRDYYPEYKAGRRKGREESDLNWDDIFGTLNKIRNEIKENFPYKYLEVFGAEADDIIGFLCEENRDEKIFIISGDKDFIQLQKYSNVTQWSPITKKQVNGFDPTIYLKEHILKGDTSDGVPNVLSPDNTFTDGLRQRPLSRKKIQSWLVGGGSDWNDEVKRNFQRNLTLIDLSKTPEELKNQIRLEYNNASHGDRSKLLNYFMIYKLRELTDNIGDF
jgi:hypothetical protein